MKTKKQFVLLLLLILSISQESLAQYNYGEVLQKSILFYETQQAGDLPAWNRISWRGDAGLTDGQAQGLDLTGGWFDAGDHIKFGLPLAYTITALNWGYIHYEDGYKAVNQDDDFKRNIKWVTDYFIKCHPSPNEFYAQVSAKNPDHSFWMPAEMVDHKYTRQAYKLSTSNPGTDVACETAAALASASIIFKDEDPAYSATLLSHAIDLYNFGDNFRGKYTDEGGIPAVGTYSSGGFNDELVWGAIWLYKATGDAVYLQKAENGYDNASPDFKWSFVWDDKSYANMVELAIITGNQKYKDDSERHLDWWQTDGTVAYSPGGLAWLTQWGSLRHTMNASLTALIYSDNVVTTKKQKYHDFAIGQMNYILGDNPANRSYVTGFGNNPPTKPHHRGQHSSWLRDLSNPVESRHGLWGALVGGPGVNDDYEDDRSDFQKNEVACDYNACFQGVLARMVEEYGGSELPNFPPDEVAGEEFLNEVKINSQSDIFTEVAVWLNNRSGWPARKPASIGYRYYFDFTEGIAAGYSVNDLTVTINGSADASEIAACNEDDHIYYVEVNLNDPSDFPIPAGQESYRKEVQMRIALPAGSPPAAWDPTNDFSYNGLTTGLSKSEFVPIYVDGELAGGNEPNCGASIKAKFTASETSGPRGLEVSFNAATSSGPQGSTLSYSWKFGDNTSGSGVTATKTYNAIGVYTVELTVTDGTLTDTETTTITISNQKPVAVIVSSSNGGIAPVTIDFDGTNSSDADGDNLTYSWDFGDNTDSDLATTAHEYTEIGTYTVKLTVNDGIDNVVTNKTITITDGSPVAVINADVTTGITPLTVNFDASGSIDPTGGNLTYNWDLGNGQTASGVTASATYTANATVLLTVTTEDNKSATATQNIVVSEDPGCSFDTPRTTALPGINTSFTNIHVLGDGGPDLSNVNNFTINWDLSNNGLYQFSINTTNGSPNWWNDLLGTITHNFSQVSPSATLAGSGFSGLDGDYDITIDDGNFVMVSKTGGFTIYFSNSPTPPDCNISSCTANGGSVSTDGGVTEVNTITGDGIADFVTFSTTSSDTNYAYVVTDNNGIVLELPEANAADFEGATSGICRVYGVAFEETLNISLGDDITSLTGCQVVSGNYITINRTAFIDPCDGLNGGSVSTDGGSTSVNTVTGDGIADLITFNTTSTDSNYSFIVTDNNGTVISLPISNSTDFEGATVGICRVYGASHDGSLGIAVGDNITSVSGCFNISDNYITVTKTAEPVNNVPVALIIATPISGDVPLEVNFDASSSTDADGDALTFTWDFGDSTATVTGSTIQHTYTSVGMYTVTLTANDTKDSGIATVNIQVKDTTTTGGELPSYIDRFKELRADILDPANGYFSPEGTPYHSIESLIIEAPDHGHESTSELYSYWIWLEAMHGRISGDWQPLNDAWVTMEQQIIPTSADQPSTSFYDAAKPATYASEFPLPSGYPAALQTSVPVGQDPISPDLSATYGSDDIYGMHWLLDADNFYGFGNRGDGVSKPSYINTFQRGEEESVWESVPHPSWEEFKWGGADGYLPLFIDDNPYAKQWRYTNAPDADARVVQAMYWASEWVKEQNLDPKTTIPMDKASKMGDYLRLAMFDKYFKPMGIQDENGAGGTGYESAHYLMSWYYSWGGSLTTTGGWSWRISSSHCHFGYQNPVAAWALSTYDELKPISQNGVSDWSKSLDRQLEFYQYLQSKEGAIAGGATNSWNGNYSAYPAGKSEFYDMAYDDNPVYHDPGSGTWGGWQGWSVERIAEFYYLTNDPRAKKIIDKYVGWVKDNLLLTGDGFEIPAGLEWSGEPEPWNPGSPAENNNLSVTVTGRNQDLGIAASYAKTLTFYAAATEKYETLDTDARDLAREVLDRMWTKYRDNKGLSAPEARGDYTRFFEQEVYVPSDFTGAMPSGAAIEPGATFFSLRPQYANDPDFQKLQDAYDAGEDYTQNYHRAWAQIEIALANAEYGYFFGGGNRRPSASITSPANEAVFSIGSDITIEADASDPDGTITSIEFFQNGISIGTDSSAPYNVVLANVAEGNYALTAIATDDGNTTGISTVVNIVVGNAAPVGDIQASVLTGNIPLVVNFDASGSTDPNGDALSYSWDFGDGETAIGIAPSHTFNEAGTFLVTLTVNDGNGGSSVQNVTINAIDPTLPQGLRVEYRDGGNDSPSDNQIHPHLRIVNETSDTFSYTDLTIRYWFSNEQSTSLNYFTDYAAIGSSNVNGQFVANGSSSDADYYLEVSFTSAAGTLAAGGNSGNIQGRFADVSWGNFNENNDYSYDATKTDYTAHNKVALYYKGQLVYGVEPSSSTRAGESDASYTVYPNPVENILKIKSSEDLKDANISIINSEGKIVTSEKVGTSTKDFFYHIGDLPSGIYIVKINTQNSMVIRRAIKQ